MIVEKEIPFARVPIDRALIYAGMGSGGYVPDREMVGRIEAGIAHLAAFARPRYLYRIVPLGAAGDTGVELDGRTFRMGKVIAPFFREAESVAVFVATTGAEFDEWLHQAKRSGDILEEFVADAIGSAFAEGVGAAMIAALAAAQAALGNRIGNSYSPGYCGWSVTSQRELFSLLPERPCGVTLGDSCLMSPIKSISGLIAVGPGVVKHPYGCEVCTLRHCYKNRHP